MRDLAIVVIVGPGGLGKTSPVAHWLPGDAHRQPGGILSAGLGGHELSGAAMPGGVLDGFPRNLEVAPEDMPGTLHEQAALSRSVTAGGVAEGTRRA